MRMPVTSLRSSGGFSTLELITVLVLLGVLSSLVAPSLRGVTERHRTQRALDRVSADVALTRLLAIREGRSHRMRITGTDSYVVERVLSNGQAQQVKLVTLGGDFPGTRLDLPDGGLQLEFTSRGLLRNLNADVFIKAVNSRTRDSIFVSPAGRVYRAY